MNRDTLDLITSLRHQLHACAEISGMEMETKRTLKQFLTAHTSLQLFDIGDGFYAAHREADRLPGIALRADYDALATPDGKAAHLCGHDGHAAALCAVAMALEGKKVGKNVYLLFQPAEETGAGAAPCCALFEHEKIDRIYGCHNLPGFAFGQVYTRSGTFSCASCGITLYLKGAATHAAYPELGLNPAPAVGELLQTLPSLASPEKYSGMTLCTVIGVKMGEKAFGAAAADAQVWLTLRAEHNDDLQLLRSRILNYTEHLASDLNLGFLYDEQDVFPAAENDPTCAQFIMDRCHGEKLAVPMRWSEDFGHYLLHKSGAFFGIGCGEDHPGLHTECYEYPDGLLGPTCDAFMALLND